MKRFSIQNLQDILLSLRPLGSVIEARRLMESESDRFAEFVEHPRYGREPRVTGLNPQPHDKGVNLHWNAKNFGVYLLVSS